jgi:hypothetical protein
MELDAQQRLQIYCAILRGVTSNHAVTTNMAKPEKVVEIAVELTEHAITAATSGEHF